MKKWMACRPRTPDEGTPLEMKPEEIIERIMSQHWDISACHCWICEAGRENGLGSRSDYLRQNDPTAKGLGQVAILNYQTGERTA